MALKTFTATRAPVAGDTRKLTSWHLSAAATAIVVNFCENTSATVIFQVQVPLNTSASQAYIHPLRPPSGGLWHIELVSGALNFGAVDLI